MGKLSMGNQRRSWPRVQNDRELHGGVIAMPIMPVLGTTNTRQSIGFGKRSAVPEWLDFFELWQGTSSVEQRQRPI